ncbi:MAG: type I-B CRISPR-associated protein Cas5 [Anaerolineae bacterium]|nr:type I-B CRISPR-associated protein Cas5 [Anaerolineae bacterium]
MSQSQPISERLRVLRVVIAGPVTSFRYPHFVQGVQPTYEMPPPSTIYGLICAVTGTFEPPEAFAFGVHFTFEAKFRDLEHIHLDIPYQQANPFQRELLYNPRLTLYLAPEQYAEAFKRPHYPLALGRSQDLMSCLTLDIVTLERAERAYFEHTLLPADYAPRFQRTVAVTMARFIDRRRRPSWGQYAMLKDRVAYPSDEDPFRMSYEPVWVDPDTPEHHGAARGVIFHTFV